MCRDQYILPISRKATPPVMCGNLKGFCFVLFNNYNIMVGDTEAVNDTTGKPHYIQ